MSASAYWSEKDRVWYVPVAGELFDSPEKVGPVEPARVELREGQLWITELEADRERAASH